MDNLPTSAPPDVGAKLSADYVMPSAQHGKLALRASACKQCGQQVFPASDICPFCLSTDCVPLPLEGRAKLYSFTRIHTGPKMWQTPYAIAYADFPNGLRLLAKLSGSDPAQGDWQLDSDVNLVVVPVEDDASAQSPSYRYYFEQA
jgi:uncharacterized OB-fold protein